MIANRWLAAVLAAALGLMGGTIAHAAETAPAKAPLAGNPDAWRYQYHQGHWWYWKLNEQWAFWDGIHWIDYSSAAWREELRRQDELRRLQRIEEELSALNSAAGRWSSYNYGRQDFDVYPNRD